MAGGYTPATNPNKRLYNGGSEWQDDIDGLADYYSTFFREYDAVIGRFNGVDPMAEVTDELSAYAYSGNNPIMMNDPLGLFNEGGTRTRGRVYLWGPDYEDAVEVFKNAGDNYLQKDYLDWHNSRYQNPFDFEAGGGSGPNQSFGRSITTAIPGMGQFYFGFTTTNRWGFYNTVTNALYSGTNTMIRRLLEVLTDFATSPNEFVKTRFSQMSNDAVRHNIFTAGSMALTVLDPSGRITSTNTAFTTNPLKSREDLIESNGVTDYRAKFAADFLSTTYLASRSNSAFGSGQSANGYFVSETEIRWVSGDRWSQSAQYNQKIFVQSIGNDADRAYFENVTLDWHGLPKRTFYTSNYMDATGTRFQNPGGAIPIQWYGIFFYTGFHY